MTNKIFFRAILERDTLTASQKFQELKNQVSALSAPYNDKLYIRLSRILCLSEVVPYFANGENLIKTLRDVPEITSHHDHSSPDGVHMLIIPVATLEALANDQKLANEFFNITLKIPLERLRKVEADRQFLADAFGVQVQDISRQERSAPARAPMRLPTTLTAWHAFARLGDRSFTIELWGKRKSIPQSLRELFTSKEPLSQKINAALGEDGLFADGDGSRPRRGNVILSIADADIDKLRNNTKLETLPEIVRDAGFTGSRPPSIHPHQTPEHWHAVGVAGRTRKPDPSL
jgi:hypothetical protein